MKERGKTLDVLCAVLLIVSFGYFAYVLKACDALSREEPDPSYRQVRHGIASWYRGDGMVCASRQYPIGSHLRVSHGNLAVFVTVTSRGPAWRFFRQGRCLDLSLDAFKWLAAPKFGLICVQIERVP